MINHPAIPHLHLVCYYDETRNQNLVLAEKYKLTPCDFCLAECYPAVINKTPSTTASKKYSFQPASFKQVLKQKELFIMSSPPLQHLLYALGQITRHYGYRPDSLPLDGSTISYFTGEQLGMLNLLSLLLVTAGPGDVAAMSIYSRKGSPVKLFYAKNRPCTYDETTYIGLLFEIATSTMIPPTIKYHTLLALVVSKCKSKIILRLRKMSSILKHLGGSRWLATGIEAGGLQVEDDNNRPTTQTDRFIRNIVGSKLFPADSPLDKFLKRWFQQVVYEFAPGRFFDYKTFSKSVFNAINICYFLAQDSQAITIVNPELRRPIEKLGQYIQAIRLLVHEIPKLHASQAGGLIVKEVSIQLNLIFFVLFCILF